MPLPDPKFFTTVSGTQGWIKVGGYDLAAARWQVTWRVNPLSIPSQASRGFPDVISGGNKSGVVTASGPWHKDQNPFTDLTLYLASFRTVVLQIDDKMPDGTTATMASVLIHQWDFSDDADGMPAWSMTGTTDWKFKTFGEVDA